MLLVYGQIPCFPSWGKAVSPPGHNRMVSDYYEAMKAHAKDFLMFGRMRRPLISEAQCVPPGIQSAWEDGRGNTGVFAANTQTQDVTVQVPAPGPGAWKATFYLGASPQQTANVTAGNVLEWRWPSGRLVSIVFQPWTLQLPAN